MHSNLHSFVYNTLEWFCKLIDSFYQSHASKFGCMVTNLTITIKKNLKNVSISIHILEVPYKFSSIQCVEIPFTCASFPDVCNSGVPKEPKADAVLCINASNPLIPQIREVRE